MIAGTLSLFEVQKTRHKSWDGFELEIFLDGPKFWQKRCFEKNLHALEYFKNISKRQTSLNAFFFPQNKFLRMMLSSFDL